MVIRRSTQSNSVKSVVRGSGLLNTVINKLPFEVHLPGYQFCGPGTKLDQRLKRGDSGINPLDSFCKEHDILYSKTTDTTERNKADLHLAEKAWQRVKAKDSKLGEKLSAYFVTNAMKAKAKFGMGMQIRKKNTSKKIQRKHANKNILRKTMAHAKSAVIAEKPTNLEDAISIAVRAAKRSLPKNRRSVKFPPTRVIPIPKTGGVLPFLVPLFAGLSALGALSTAGSSIAKSIHAVNDARRNFHENKRHNETMEAIAMGKGLFLKPYRTGLGLFLNPKHFL